MQWCAVGPVSEESLLTCFVGARLDVLEPGALCQDAELTVAVLAIQLLGLTIADVLRGGSGRTAKQKVEKKKYFDLLSHRFSTSEF